jgi:signal transduction histidine kinase
VTLRVRLALLIAAAIAVALLMQGVFSYLNFSGALYASLDHDLGAYFGQTRSESERQPRPLDGPRVDPPRDVPTPSQPPLDTLGSARLIVDGTVVRTWAQFPSDILLPKLSTDARDNARVDAPVSLGLWRVRGERLPNGGYLQAAISEQRVLSNLEQYRQSVGLTIVLVSVFGAWLAWWLTGPALQPLRHLTQTARRVANSGDLSLRVTTTSGGELGDLSQTFNDMLERLTEFLGRETQFTRNASHELRTPLTSLKLHLSAYRQGLTTPVETLEVVGEEVERMTRLTESLLVLAREGRAVPVNLDLAALTAEMAANVGAIYSGPNNLQLLADPTLLQQAIQNLLENAAKYAPRSDVNVSLAIRPKDQTPHAVLSVKDNGPGLSAEALARATQAFYRAPNVRVAGSGLGLSVVEQVAKVHHGRLQLKHNLPQGLEVQLWLPLDVAREARGKSGHARESQPSV